MVGTDSPNALGPGSPASPEGLAEPRAARTALQRRDPAAAVVGVVEGMLGVSLGSVGVVGGQPARQAAGLLGATALTAGGQVYLPPEVAGTPSARNLGVLGHELAHVAQQRMLGGVVDEASPAGRHLEGQALAVGRAVERLARAPGGLDAARGIATGTPRALHAPPGQAPLRSANDGRALADERAPAVGRAVASPRGSLAGGGSAPGAGRLRSAPMAAPLPLAQAVQPAPATPPAVTTPVPAVAAQRLSLPGSATQLATDAKRLAGGTGRAIAASAGIRVGGPKGKQEKHEPSEVERLAKEIYPYVRERLRAELLADRDRAGLVTDLYRTGLYGG